MCIRDSINTDNNKLLDSYPIIISRKRNG
jgi:hypothetical protein